MINNSPYSPASTIYSPGDSTGSVPSSLPAPHQPRQRLRPWLIDQINSGKIPGLKWLDLEKMIFRIPWKHFGRPGVDEYNDAMLFRLWALHTKKYHDGEPPDISTWKTRFRCALHKLPDIDELNQLNQTEGDDPYRVYQFKKKGVDDNIGRHSPYTSSAMNSPHMMPQVKSEAVGSPYTPASVNSPLSLPQHENPVVLSPMSNFQDMKPDFGRSMQDPNYSQLQDEVDAARLIEDGLDLREGSYHLDEYQKRYMRKRKHYHPPPPPHPHHRIIRKHEGDTDELNPFPTWLVQHLRHGKNKSAYSAGADDNVVNGEEEEEEEDVHLDVVGGSDNESSLFDNEDRESKTSETKSDDLIRPSSRRSIEDGMKSPSSTTTTSSTVTKSDAEFVKICKMFARNEVKDSDELFGKMIAMELKRFPSHLKYQAKYELNNILYKFQMQNHQIMMNEHAARSPNYIYPRSMSTSSGHQRLASIQGHRSSSSISSSQARSSPHHRPSPHHTPSSLSEHPTSPSPLSRHASPHNRRSPPPLPSLQLSNSIRRSPPPAPAFPQPLPMHGHRTAVYPRYEESRSRDIHLPPPLFSPPLPKKMDDRDEKRRVSTEEMPPITTTSELRPVQK